MTNRLLYQQLLDELNDTKIQLEEANDTIEAIRYGQVDALVVNGKDGHQLYTLKSADQTYRIFIEQMTEGALTLNQNNVITYCNSRFASMIGLPLERVTGQLFCNLFTSEERHSCEQLLETAWSKDVKEEFQFVTHSGIIVPVLVSLKTLDLDGGLSMSVIITDLTNQKETQTLLKFKNRQLEEAQGIAQQLNVNLEKTVKERTKELEITIQEKSKAERELRSNEERLIQILETMAEGVGIIDINENLTYANPMAQKLLGLLPSNVPGRAYDYPVWENLKVDGTILPHHQHPLTMMMATGKSVYDYEIAIKPPDEECIYISINAAPLHDQNNILIGGVGTFVNVTNRRKNTQLKDEFISVASHELKTPLTSLKASMQLLTKLINTNPTSEKIPAFIEKANKNISKMVHLTEDLINVSKLKHGQLPLNKTRVKLYDFIIECTEHIRAADTHDLRIEGDLGLYPYADQQQIGQVIVNLVNNSVKYAPNSKRIDIRVDQQDKMIKVSVKDYGIGIPHEKLPHLFDRYYRVDPSGIQFSGLGLGLYISAEIIKRHDGKIGVESIAGVGSTFWFTLPLQ